MAVGERRRRSVDRCAGLDWAKDTHQVCVLEADGEPLLQRGFAHGERDLDGMCELLVELGVKRIAIERPEGVLVERLLEAGLVVLPIHPNQLKAARPRFRAAGGKSDAFDAFCPGAALIFRRLDSPIALAFLERYPSPTDARALGEKRLAGFLIRHGYCGGKSASELLAKLRSAPRGRARETEETARRTAVLSLLTVLRPVVEQIGLLESRIADAVRAHPDGEVFLSLFRNPDSTLTAAKLLSEIGDRRERYPSAEARAADAGMSPVAKESGRRKVATFRRACDKRLRD